MKGISVELDVCKGSIRVIELSKSLIILSMLENDKIVHCILVTVNKSKLSLYKMKISFDRSPERNESLKFINQES